MQNESSTKKESSTIKKKWLRIIIIVAIGIPVLIELSTLFNLLKVQFFGKEEATNEQVQPAESVREVFSGDTLVIDESFKMVLKNMRVNVSPNRWEFEIALGSAGVPKHSSSFFIDSLGLNSGMTLPGGGESSEWSTNQEAEKMTIRREWEIPNGDIPRTLFIRLEKEVAPDSLVKVHKEVPLGTIPVRYHAEGSQEKQN